MKPKRIRFHGRGGQGTVIASILLGKALLAKGIKAMLSMPWFGVERRGAPVSAFLYIGTTSARYAITKPDFLVILHPALVSPEVVQGLKKNGVIVINTDKRPEDFFYLGPFIIATVNAEQIAIDYGIPAVNTAILGAVAKSSGVISLENLAEAIIKIEEIPKPERNIAAAKEAFSQTVIARSTINAKIAEVQPKQNKEYDPNLLEMTKFITITLTDTSDVYTGCWRVNRPVIDKALCKKCKNNPRCELFCPDMAVIIKNDCGVEIDYKYCKGCGICAKECPFKAILMVPGTEAAEIKNSDFGAVEDDNEK